MAVTINTSLQNTQADSWANDLNNGFIDIRTGAQPAANDAATGTLLVSIPLGAAAYDPAASGVAEIPAPVSAVAVAAGTAGYAQQRNAGTTRWMYGSVTATGGGGDVELSTTSIGIGDTVEITASTITQPAS